MYRTTNVPFGALAYNRLGAVQMPQYYQGTAVEDDTEETAYVVGGVAVVALAVGGLVYLGAKKRKGKR